MNIVTWDGSIRLTVQEDIAFIGMCETSQGHKYLHSWADDIHRKNLCDQNFIYLSGLDKNGDLAGYSLLKKTDEKTIEYKRIASNEPNKGFGRPFMKAVLDYLTEHTCYEKVWLDVYEANERARHVYLSLDFKETSKVDPPETSPADFGKLVIMQKSISCR